MRSKIKELEKLNRHLALGIKELEEEDFRLCLGQEYGELIYLCDVLPRQIKINEKMIKDMEVYIEQARST